MREYHEWSVMTICFYQSASFQPCCQKRQQFLFFDGPVDVQQHHSLFCRIHYLDPDINIALLVVPGVLIPTAYQLRLSGTVTEFVLAHVENGSSVQYCFDWKFLWLQAVNPNINM